MPTLTKDQILAAPLRREPVEVPEWGGSVNVRELSLAERMALEKRLKDQPPDVVLASVVAATVCGDDGNLIFGPDDLTALSAGSSEVLLRLSEIGQRLSGMLPDAVEAAAGNSEASPESGSPTGSQRILG